LPAVEIIRNQSRYGRTLKRIGDIIFSLIVLTLGSPIFILIGILVKLSSPGSVFYIQKRVGRNYREFGCIKFRTMYKDADDLLPNLLEKYPLMRKEFEKDFKLRQDPRITKLGRFLRRSSLDELPQFFNVLKGEMSVVGPRPIVGNEIIKYSLFMEEVISVRPGLTDITSSIKRLYLIISLPTIGLGPTTLISPFKTLKNWGNSSKLDRRRNLPNFVILGS
jgi:lipopolysaccharide/colanic/teichoic acid biosynthesis glycosyltransferase